MRLRCHVWGCHPGQLPACDRCGAPLYWEGPGSLEFIEHGLIHRPPFTWRHWVAAVLWPRCLHCRRVLLFRRRVGFDGAFCSDECADSWLPF